MEKDRISIFCATDENYIPYCGIMLISLFENNRQNDIDIYVLSSIKNEKKKEELLNLAQSYNQSKRLVRCMFYMDCNFFQLWGRRLSISFAEVVLNFGRTDSRYLRKFTSFF